MSWPGLVPRPPPSWWSRDSDVTHSRGYLWLNAVYPPAVNIGIIRDRLTTTITRGRGNLAKAASNTSKNVPILHNEQNLSPTPFHSPQEDLYSNSLHLNGTSIRSAIFCTALPIKRQNERPLRYGNIGHSSPHLMHSIRPNHSFNKRLSCVFFYLASALEVFLNDIQIHVLLTCLLTYICAVF